MMTKNEIRSKCEEKELIKRCIAVHMCPECGRDFKDVSGLSSHWTALACLNKRCSEYDKIKKSW